jgi:hypothetical protein
MQRLQLNHRLTRYVTGEEQQETMELCLMQIDSRLNAGYSNVQGNGLLKLQRRLWLPIPIT